MSILKGKYCQLRALEPKDLDFLYALENDTEIWEISNTLKPYSRAVLKNYLGNAHRDIYEVKQLRLCICNPKDESVGFIDLFDFDPKHSRAGIGIILNTTNRNKGLGAEALSLLLDYTFSVLDLHQVYANILEDNLTSIHLFEKLGFQRVGVKKDWIRWDGKFKNELLYQKLKP
ncbi:GNAT family N-acetyltransferase [Muricauda sp. SCSIO 64092]|nr:GNAT family N-acetyltransferase [Muricauda sp. SCSIO 64092]UOY09356.1 GNAT family N-acetyltransferase [Muricauda sp. SCSIO 64092]